MDNDELKGIIPRIVESIFKSILQAPPTVEFTVKVAYMEIYMEKIRDLLNPVNDNLSVHEDKVRGIYVKGLVEVYVSTVAEVYEVLHRGGNARIVAYTRKISGLIVFRNECGKLSQSFNFPGHDLTKEPQ